MLARTTTDITAVIAAQMTPDGTAVRRTVEGRGGPARAEEDRGEISEDWCPRALVPSVSQAHRALRLAGSQDRRLQG